MSLPWPNWTEEEWRIKIAESEGEDLTKALHYRTTFQGLDISIENRKGSTRSGITSDGTPWSTVLTYPYGYIRMTEGVDGDHVDCFLGPHDDAHIAYVIHVLAAPDFVDYDEDKVMLGFYSADSARMAFLENYGGETRFYGGMHMLLMEEFKTKAFATKDDPQMIKAHIREHRRFEPNGRITIVHEYEQDRGETGEWNGKYVGHVWWHGSPSGDLRGGRTGLHLGTKLAATQALEARIGIPADGKGWTGNREYGKTKLAGKKTLLKMDPRGYNQTGFNCDIPDSQQEDFYPTKILKYADGSDMPMTVKPRVEPFIITGAMTNSMFAPHEDFKANAIMAGQITRYGKAKRGFYYRNIGEDSSSVSAVVPDGSHLQRLAQPDLAKAKVRQHQRTTPTGKLALVHEYQRKDQPHGTPTAIPKGLTGLAAEAKKAPTFEDFRKDFSLQIKHGTYYHVTDNPHFTIDPTKGPRDRSSMASGDDPEPGALMITSDLDLWTEEYEGSRGYVAIINMQDVPRSAYYQVNRGFGNEFYVTDPSRATVQEVLTVPQALKRKHAQQALLEHYITDDESLKRFYDAVHGQPHPSSATITEGPAAPSVPRLTREQVRDYAWEVADAMHFPRGRLIVEEHGAPVNVAGISFGSRGGQFDPSNGLVTLYAEGLVSKGQVIGIMAHEVQHARFQTVMDEYDRERKQIIDDPNPDDKIRADGTLLREFINDFPVYALIQPSWDADWTELNTTGNITPYSAAYWTGFWKNEVQAKTAINETLAEIALYNWQTGKLVGPMVWQNFYCAVNNAYSRILEDRERKAKEKNIADNAFMRDLEQQWAKDELKDHDHS